MLTLTDVPPPTAAETPNTAVPMRTISEEVDLIISAMEAGGQGFVNRRAEKRIPLRVQATVRLFVDLAGHRARVIFTRDIHSRCLGFLTPERLPLGYGGVIDLPTRDGGILSIACTILRCRLAVPGWYEGMVYFNREQTSLEQVIR